MSYLGIFLTTSAGTIAGIGIWLFLIKRSRNASMPLSDLLKFVFAAGLIIRISYSVLTPSFYAPDEESHFKYVKYLSDNVSFPVQTTITGEDGNDWEYYQPPLYYLLMTPIYRFSELLFHSRTLTVILMRLASVLMWCVTMLFTLRIMQRLGIKNEFVRVFTAGMTALLPTYTFISSMINNDNLVIMLGSIILYILLNKELTIRIYILAGILLGAALLAKHSSIVFFPLAGLLIILRNRTMSPKAILGACLVFFIGFLIWSPWALRNIQVYHSITAEEIASDAKHWNSIFHAVYGTLYKMNYTFWAVSGIYNNIHYFYPVIGRHVLYLAFAALMYGLIFNRERLDLRTDERRGIFISMAVALIINFLLVLRFGILYDQGQGRLMFPLLIPAALIISALLKVFPVTDSAEARIHTAGFWMTYSISFMFFSLAVFSRS